MARQGSSPGVAIIGAGFGGLGMAYYLKTAGISDITIFEQANELGGTWRENTYPGAGCDVPSHLYSFSFEQHYPWEWRYARQSEILDYARHVADRHGIRAHIRFNCAVEGADFDAERGLWKIRLNDGSTQEARFLISSVGQLHRPAYPKVPGLDSFQGTAFHSAHWNHDYDLRGKRVAVIGTGASAVQFVPEIAPLVEKLHVFQRSPGWTISKIERHFTGLERMLLKRLPVIENLDRARIFAITEVLAAAYEGNGALKAVVTKMAQRHLQTQIEDPELRRKLTPDYPVGCKRILLSNDWLPALARPNVEVVTEDIREVNASGVLTADNAQRDVDAIIYGTGFHATEFLAPMQINGLQGRALHDFWRASNAAAYFGMAVSGFPNFFVLYGPNTNLGSGSILYMLESQQRYVAQIIDNQANQGWRYADLRPEVMERYVAEIRQRSAETTYDGDCQSWYKNADGVNTNNWIGSQLEFRRRTREADLDNYQRIGSLA